MASMPINLFDCLLVCFLAAGMVRGRHHGLSNEGLRVLRWVMLLVGCALVYQPAGSRICAAGFFDALSAYLLCYLGAALLIFLVFSVIERRLRPKLAGSDAFGRGEYYLGMGAGLVRYGCMILMALAVLNARQFSAREVQASERAQVDSFGSTLFPTLRGLQAAVFERSLTGPLIRNHLSFFLITPTEAGETAPASGGDAHSRMVKR